MLRVVFKSYKVANRCFGTRHNRLSEIKKRRQQSGSVSSPPGSQLSAGPVHYGEFVAWLAVFSAALSKGVGIYFALNASIDIFFTFTRLYLLE